MIRILADAYGFLSVSIRSYRKWPCDCSIRSVQWRHQDLKSGGARREQRLIMGGQTCARSAHSERVAHIASAKREPIFLNCWGPIFFWAKHVRGAHIASA